MSIFLVDAFTSKKFAGNRAGVVFDAENYSDEMKQQIASELNASETVFAKWIDSTTCEARFFTPTREIDFCGHATVALFYMLAKQGRISVHDGILNLFERTRAGTFPITVKESNGAILVSLRQTDSHFAAPSCTVAEVVRALRLTEDALDSRFPLGLARTGNWHLIVGVKSKQYLEEIDYDQQALSKILLANKAVTAHVFCKEGPLVYHARNFGPTIGIAEDPATGSAAGAFGAYLVREGLVGDGEHTISIVQGERMGRPSELSLLISCQNGNLTHLEITGTAKASFQLHLES